MRNVQVLKEDKNSVVIKVSGEIDVYNIGEFKEAIKTLYQESRSITIDTSDLDFLDSSGLGILIDLSKRMMENGKSIELINPPDHIMKLLSTTGVDSIINVKRDRSLEFSEGIGGIKDYCNDEVSIILPAKPAYVGVARLTLASIASRYNFNIESIEDIKIAIAEVLTNAISHNNPMVEEINIKTKFDCKKGTLRIDIYDEGKGFDQKILEASNKNSVEPGGLGLFIVKSLMDEVEIITSPGEGTYIKMYKSGDE
ncbi:MAG: anti-sigma factor antagonist [Clostridia bacterium]